MNNRLVSETALDRGETELILTTEQAQNASSKLLRRLASQSESDEIHGKSVKLEQLQYFTCQKTLNDYLE